MTAARTITASLIPAPAAITGRRAKFLLPPPAAAADKVARVEKERSWLAE